jgi:hypothetical protein
MIGPIVFSIAHKIEGSADRSGDSVPKWSESAFSLYASHITCRTATVTHGLSGVDEIQEVIL